MNLVRMCRLAMLVKCPLQLVRIFLAVGPVACGRYAEHGFIPARSATGFHRNVPQPFGDSQKRLLHVY